MFNTDRDRKLYLALLGQPITDTDACFPIEQIVALSQQAQNDQNNGIPNPLFIDNGNNFMNDNDDRERYWKNCGKLSGAKIPYFDGGLLKSGPIGDYAYMSTRGSSFSNRNQIGIIHVSDALLLNGGIGVVGVVTGGIIFFGFAGAAVVAFRRKHHRKRALIDAQNQINGALIGGARRSSDPNSASVSTEPQGPKRARPGITAAPAAVGGVAAGSAGSTCTALYNHAASEAGELEFRKGDIITVIRKDDSGWWEGRTSDGKKGIFPTNYVQVNN